MKSLSDEKCPVCGKAMEQLSDTLDGWCLMEDYIGCVDGCYSYFYYTGTTEITIKNKQFSYYHTATQEQKNAIQAEADKYLKEVIAKTNVTP